MRSIVFTAAIALPTSWLALAQIGLTGTTTPEDGQPPRVSGSSSDPTLAARDDQKAYEYTAIGAVIRANSGRVPANGTELMRALNRLGEVTQLPIPFSAVNPGSNLMTPRVVITPFSHPPGRRSDKFLALTMQNTRDGPLEKLQFASRGDPAALPGTLSRAGVTEPSLDGRLFLAVNMHEDQGTIRIREIEFISWNSRRKRFDFGVIECQEPEGKIHFLDGVRCFSCHKSRGPIFGLGPWSNSTHNDILRHLALRALARRPEQKSLRDELEVLSRFGLNYQPGITGRPVLTKAMVECTTIDGISLVCPEPEACDMSCRLGACLPRDREILQALTRRPDGLKALAVLTAAVLSPGPIEQNAQAAARPFNAAVNRYAPQFADRVDLIKKRHKSVLIDFNPSGSMGRLVNVITNFPAAWGQGSIQRRDVILIWDGTPEQVSRYATRRQGGDTRLPSNHQPSNPSAFVKPTNTYPSRPAEAINAVDFARVIGITEGDRKYFAEELDKLLREIDDPQLNPPSLAYSLANSEPMKSLFANGNVPDREEFKEAFATALREYARSQNLSSYAHPERSRYASGPLPPRDDADAPEPAIVPTTACLRCHDLQGVGRTALNPIPQLAFDPFDEKARDAWAARATPTRRTDVLKRLQTRLFIDNDMPPIDSPEHETFRLKHPEAFASLKTWIQEQLQRPE